MKEIIKKNWEYTLFEKKDKMILSVLCGSVALFTVNIKLNESEKESFEKFGESYIDDLAEKVRTDPSDFQIRHGDMSSFV